MPKNSQIRGVDMDLFDNDVLGTSNVRMTPDFPAVKKSWKSLRTWYIILPIVLMVLALGFLFIQQDLLYSIVDKIIPVYSSAVGGETAEADALDAYTVASVHTHVDADNDHYCDDCNSKTGAHQDRDLDHYCDSCKQAISECKDAVGEDHKCDVCDRVVSECYDKNNNLACDLCGAPVYPIWLALIIVAVPFILIEIICLIIFFAKKKRLARISIEFYKDIIVYRDGKNVLMRTFHGSYTASVRQDTRRERRKNYGTVTIYCPGGPAMSMVFSRIAHPHGLVAQLRAARPKESFGIATAAPDAN